MTAKKLTLVSIAVLILVIITGTAVRGIFRGSPWGKNITIGFGESTSGLWINERSILSPTDAISSVRYATDDREPESMTAREATEHFYDLMGAAEYAEAYQMLSPSMPHRKTQDEFVREGETFYQSYKLLSIESYPIWKATVNAGTPTAEISGDTDRCKRFIVEVDVEYLEATMGSGPSGIYTYALTMVRQNDEGWEVAQIDTIPDPHACESYE